MRRLRGNLLAARRWPMKARSRCCSTESRCTHRAHRLDRPGEPARLLVRPTRRRVRRAAGRRCAAAVRGRRSRLDLRPGDWVENPAHAPPSGRVDTVRAADRLARGPSHPLATVGAWRARSARRSADRRASSAWGSGPSGPSSRRSSRSPEAREVARHLDRPARRREQVQRDAAPAGDARRVRQAEHLLQPHRQRRLGRVRRSRSECASRSAPRRGSAPARRACAAARSAARTSASRVDRARSVAPRTPVERTAPASRPASRAAPRPTGRASSASSAAQERDALAATRSRRSRAAPRPSWRSRSSIAAVTSPVGLGSGLSSSTSAPSRRRRRASTPSVALVPLHDFLVDDAVAVELLDLGHA